MAAPKSTLSELVKEMVKEMDADEFYARGDMYDESAEVTRSIQSKLTLHF